jgi:hypothetical protein
MVVGGTGAGVIESIGVEVGALVVGGAGAVWPYETGGECQQTINLGPLGNANRKKKGVHWRQTGQHPAQRCNQRTLWPTVQE